MMNTIKVGQVHVLRNDKLRSVKPREGKLCRTGKSNNLESSRCDILKGATYVGSLTAQTGWGLAGIDN